MEIWLKWVLCWFASTAMIAVMIIWDGGILPIRVVWFFLFWCVCYLWKGERYRHVNIIICEHLFCIARHWIERQPVEFASTTISWNSSLILLWTFAFLTCESTNVVYWESMLKENTVECCMLNIDILCGY